MKIRLILILFFVAAFSTGVVAQVSLEGNRWQPTYVRGARLDSTEPFIDIDASGTKFTGSTGCNIMNGTITVRDRSIKFSPVITTKRACTVSTGRVEGAVLRALAAVDRFQFSRETLRLYARNQLIMELERVSRPETDDEPKRVADQLSLEDRKWILTSVSGSAIPKVQELAFINFNPEKGSAGGDTSCNAFGADYTVDRDKISISQEISTMRACIEDARMSIERGFLDGLQRANRFEIRGDTLTLYHDRKLLLTFTGQKRQ